MLINCILSSCFLINLGMHLYSEIRTDVVDANYKGGSLERDERGVSARERR